MPNKNIKDYASKGGLARKAKCSDAVLSASGVKAAKARWDKYREVKNHVCSDLCECATCGRLKYRHSQYSEIKCEFVCLAKNIKKI
jgi:glycogen synthase